jgi:hypothetical protein
VFGQPARPASGAPFAPVVRTTTSSGPRLTTSRATGNQGTRSRGRPR